MDQQISESYGVLVNCTGEADQKRLYDQMMKAGRKCRLVMI